MTDSAEGIEYGPCSCMNENGETVRVGPEDFCTECFTPRGCCGPGRPVERSVTIEVTVEDLMAQAETDDRVLLARTWNDNPSGRLWEALWFRSGGRYYRDVNAPGVFVPAHEFPNEATFWADFEDERAKFHGTGAGENRD